MAEISRKRTQPFFLMAFFAVYMFDYMTTLTFIDRGSAAVASGSWQMALHYCC